MSLVQILISLLVCFFYSETPTQNSIEKELVINQSHQLHSDYKTYNTSTFNDVDDISNTLINRQILNSRYINLLAFIIVLSATFFIIGYHNQAKLINELKSNINQVNTHSNKQLDNKLNEKKEIDIEKSTINYVLSELEEFETNLGFLEQGISLISLAKRSNTNPSYLSKIINTYKGQNFSNYINDLRINHVLVRLKTDRKLGLYTIKAIAEETGYSNSQSFTNAFYKKTGHYPSNYIRQLKYFNAKY